MKFIEHFLPTFLIGFLIGICMALSLRYPLEVDRLKPLELICKNTQLTQVYIGLDGNVYEIVCKSGLDLKYPDGYFIEQKESLK